MPAVWRLSPGVSHITNNSCLPFIPGSPLPATRHIGFVVKLLKVMYIVYPPPQPQTTTATNASCTTSLYLTNHGQKTQGDLLTCFNKFLKFLNILNILKERKYIISNNLIKKEKWPKKGECEVKASKLLFKSTT